MFFILDLQALVSSLKKISDINQQVQFSSFVN